MNGRTAVSLSIVQPTGDCTHGRIATPPRSPMVTSERTSASQATCRAARATADSPGSAHTAAITARLAATSVRSAEHATRHISVQAEATEHTRKQPAESPVRQRRTFARTGRGWEPSPSIRRVSHGQTSTADVLPQHDRTSNLQGTAGPRALWLTKLESQRCGAVGLRYPTKKGQDLGAASDCRAHGQET